MGSVGEDGSRTVQQPVRWGEGSTAEVPVFNNPAATVAARARRSTRLRRLVATAVAVPLAVLGLVTVGAPAAQAAAVAPATQTLPGSGFPAWYEDNNGNRVEACIEANDPNCVLPGAEPDYNPAAPLSFPTNYPSEFFYAYAQSSNVATPGCGTSPAGRAFVTLAIEGAFIGGAPKAGDQMTFGRVRVRATSGLCPGQAYTFQHPFGTVTLTANAAGAIPVNTPGATVDVGCVPTTLVLCNFSLATGSPVMGSATAGFLKWDPAVGPAAPPGYLGDGVTPHPIVGANGPGSANNLTVSGSDGAGGVWTGTTNLFTVAGRLAETVASPSPLDFGGQAVGVRSTTRTVTVTNLGKATLTIPNGGVTIAGPANIFRLNGTNSCNRAVLARNATCTFGVNFQPPVLGPSTANSVNVAFTGGSRSPLNIPLLGTGTTAGAQPVVTATPNPLAFGDVRIKTTSTLPFTVTNSGTSPLAVSSVDFDLAPGSEADQFRVASTTCTGVTVAAGASCSVSVMFAPTAPGPHTATVLVASNVVATPTRVTVTGNATGGVAAVATDKLPVDEFPTWYRDENGVKVSQCIDPDDPFCVVLPDATFTRGQPLSFLPAAPGKALNFPGEFFYTVADSDQLTTPGCAGTAPGKAAYRSAIEGTFVNGDPVDTEQMVFGRERFFVTSGLCPNTNYTVTSPYGRTVIQSNAKGGIARNASTVDIGCAPVAPAVCDFSEALSSPVLGGILRWDPAVAPAAPAGYIGDAASFHKVIGAPFKEDGVNPSNYFKITGPGLPPAGLQTSQFSVMGKLQGPLEATGGVSAAGKLVLDTTAVGSVSPAKTLTVTNTGVAVPGGSDGRVTLSGITVGGVDAAEFAVAGGTCTATTTLAPGDTCTVDVTFAPVATGVRAATLTFTNNGLNNPFVVPLEGTGSDPTGAAISFAPRSLTFGQLGIGRSSSAETVTISNAGGTAPLVVSGFTLGGAAPGSYAFTNSTCADPVAPDASCTVDVVFSPTAGGAQNATLFVSDNVGAGQHSIALTGSGFAGAKSVSASVGRFGYPTFYQDSNGTRLEPCLDPANCVLLGVPQPDQPLALPDNFPDEFFYAFATSDILSIPGCNPGDPAGSAFLVSGLEGSFATTAGPVAGDQTTFTRLRLVASGLCPNVGPDAPYTAVTPYGTFAFTTDANGAVRPNAQTQDTGCGAAPCAFGDALASPGAVFVNAATPIEGFLRWDPNAATPPAGYLGDATSFQKVIGGTYVKPGATGAFNGFEIQDPTTRVLASTDRWQVAGKIAGPLAPDAFALDFGAVDQGQSSPTQTVVVTNVGADTAGVTPSLTGTGASQFAITGGTCAAGTAVAQDATCTVVVRFSPTTGTGPLAATLTLKPATGPSATVSLTGVANEVARPSITVTPGVLSYGTVTAPGPSSLSTTVTNTGTAPLTVSAATVTSGASDYAVTGGTCGAAPFTVAGGASCTVTVRFVPTAIGARTGALTLSHNAVGGSTVVSLTGTGAGASWSVSPSPVGFGTVNRGTTKTSTLSVKNTGTANGTIAAATTVVSGLPFGVVVNPATSTCFNGTAVAPGKTCGISVTFTPTAVQTYNGTLTIDGGASSLPRLTTVTLTGTGK